MKALVLAVAAMMLGCQTPPTAPRATAADPVAEMARQAIAFCGDSNVQTVSSDGFTCRPGRRDVAK
jgi:hypothetical protein